MFFASPISILFARFAFFTLRGAAKTRTFLALRGEKTNRMVSFFSFLLLSFLLLFFSSGSFVVFGLMSLLSSYFLFIFSLSVFVFALTFMIIENFAIRFRALFSSGGRGQKKTV